MAATIDIVATQAQLAASGTVAVVLNDAGARGGTGQRGAFVYLGATGWVPLAQAISTAYSPT